MGPSSHGHLAVERYLGPCLISSASARKPKKLPDEKQHATARYGVHHNSMAAPAGYVHHPQEYAAATGGWAGVPLISIAYSRRGGHKKQPQHTMQEHQNLGRSPLSRLAIHTQGAPLILQTNNGYGRKMGKTPHHRLIIPPRPLARPGCVMYEPPGTPGSPPSSSASSDTLSVASDESSGQSENALPRIIKPRKRRKKERKPQSKDDADLSSPNTNPSIVTLQPYVPLCYEFDKFRQKNAVKKGSDIHKPNREHHEGESAEPSSQLVEEGHAIVVNPAAIPSICQCRYCDPISHIWDFERRCFSPSLTPPPSRLTSLPALRPTADWSVSHHEVLRRSRSEPAGPQQSPESEDTPSTSLPPHLNKAILEPTNSSRSLEVTSEIVTAHDGHRDIEIRFFVPSSAREE